MEEVNHPKHYGGEDNPYEAIKVIKAWGLLSSFCLGNVLKYISRAGKKSEKNIEDLQKSAWYLNYEIKEQKYTKSIWDCYEFYADGELIHRLFNLSIEEELEIIVDMYENGCKEVDIKVTKVEASKK